VKPDLSAAEFLLFEKSKKVVDQALLRALNNEEEFLGYQWPPHMDRQQHSLIWSWFQRYCCCDPEGLPSDEQLSSSFNKKNQQSFLKQQQRRKKALVLFSEKRGLGKTTFATSLVYGQEKWYIHCKEAFNPVDFDKPDAKLLLIDDFTYNDSKQREMFKALMSSEPTTIREAYTNKKFKHGSQQLFAQTTRNFSSY
jgi:hypothetical protein